MSLDIHLVDPGDVTDDDNDYDENLRQEASYRREIIRRVIQFVGLFFLVYGIFVAYISTSKGLDGKSANNTVINYFWDPVISVYSLCNVAVFAAIIVNKYWSYASTNTMPVQRPDNHLIVCLMLIPLFIASVIFNIIKLVCDIAVIPCNGYMAFTEPLSTLALITGAAILVFDIGYFADIVTNWKRKIARANLIFFTVIGITNSLIITVSVQHMMIFRNESLNSSYNDRFKINETCINQSTIAQSMNNTFEKCDKYLRPTFILFCVCTLAHLIQPVEKRNDHNDEEPYEQEHSPQEVDDGQKLISLSNENLVNEIEHSIKEMNSDQNASYRLPSLSLVVCIVFLSLSLLGFIIMYSLRQGTDNTWHNQLGSLIYCSFISIIYVIGSGLSVVHIKEIQRWPPSQNRRGKIIDKCLIWVGAGGQLSIMLTFISNCVVILVSSSDKTDVLTGLTCLLIISSILMTVQTFLQTIQISLLLDRKWIRPNINSLVESLCPAVGLMGLNMGLLLLSVDQLKSPILSKESSIFFIDLFTTEMRCVGDTLAILQRLHASLLFASMIVYTHN